MSSRARSHADLVQHAPGACLIVEDGVVLAANTEAVDTLGIPLGRLVGVPLSEFLVVESQPVCTGLLERAGTSPRSAAVRLAQALSPIELTVRGLPDDLTVVGVRSMSLEHHYSSLARADLTHDQVTMLPNRYHLLSQLQGRLMAKPRHPLSLIGLWIDDLPTLAESQGERTVERVVKEVADRLQTRLRSPDVLGRFDDAGFVTLLTSDAPVAQLTTIADRLRDEVAFPVEFDDELVSFTASVAVAPLGKRSPTVEAILNHLDQMAAQTRLGGNLTEILDL